MNLDWILQIILITVQVVICAVGYLFFKRTESMKNQMERESYFYKKWANEFFDTCNEFMKCSERVLALLRQRMLLQDPKGEIGTRYQEECYDLSVNLTELELRICRILFCKVSSARDVKKQVAQICAKLATMIQGERGNMDKVIQLIEDFSSAVRVAHGEMLNTSK